MYMNILSKIDICGVLFNNISKNELKNYLLESSNDNKKTIYIVTPNVDFVVRSEKDEDFRNIINNANLSLCDSAIIYMSSFFLKRKRLKDKITGSDVISLLLEIANDQKDKIYLLGSTDENIKKTTDNISVKYPNLEVVGLSNGFFDINTESEDIVEKINKSRAKYLIIGMGSPRQEIWSNKYKDKLKTKFIISIGGLFDIFSGRKKRAPRIMQAIGLEWFWRFLSEPRRLWKRYFVKDMRFFYLLFKDIFLK